MPSEPVRQIPVVVQNPIRPARPVFPTIAITSLPELHAHETEILQRIATWPQGGNLFAINPLQLLHDINVVLTPQMEGQLVTAAGLPLRSSTAAYSALNATSGRQSVRVHVKGLFSGGVR